MNESFFAVTDLVVTVGPKGEILRWPAFGLFFADAGVAELVKIAFGVVGIGCFLWVYLLKRFADDLRLLTSGQPVNYCWAIKKPSWVRGKQSGGLDFFTFYECLMVPSFFSIIGFGLMYAFCGEAQGGGHRKSSRFGLEASVRFFSSFF